MPYIGAKELKASDIRRFDVTSSTSATHTLTWTPPTEQSLIVTINGIKQHEDAYSVSGTTLTLSSPLVATDKLEVIGINDIGTTITPAQNSVDTDKIANNAVTTAKIADDQITSAKLANAINITSGNSLTIDSGATITNSGTASGFGKVLQVVQTVKTDVFSTAAGSSSPVEITGLTASITPASSSNKILVMFSVSFGSTNLNAGGIFLYRDATVLHIGDADGVRPRITKGWETSNNWNQSAVSVTYLDSPSTTSSITYSLKIGGNGTVTNYVNRSGRDTNGSNEDGRAASNVILMEIQG